MHQDYIEEIMNKHQHLSIKIIIPLLLKLHENNIKNNTLGYNAESITKIYKELSYLK